MSKIPEVNFNPIFYAYQTALNRADTFLLVASHYQELPVEEIHIKSQLLKQHIRRLPLNAINSDFVSALKSEFFYSTTQNAFREIAEAFETFINSLCNNLAALEEQVIAEKNIYKEVSTAKGNLNSLKRKFSFLERFANIIVPHQQKIISVYNARIYLSHYQGIVTPTRFCKEPKFTTYWEIVRAVIINLDGSERELPETVEAPPNFMIKAGDSLSIRIQEKQKEFQLGSPIRFSILEVQELCCYFNYLAETVWKQFAEYLKNRSIDFQGLAYCNKV